KRRHSKSLQSAYLRHAAQTGAKLHLRSGGGFARRRAGFALASVADPTVSTMANSVTTAITVAGPLAGVGLGYIGSARIARRARDAERERELRQALGRYLGALYPFVTELRGMPAVEIGSVGQLIDRVRGEPATYLAARRGIQRHFGNRFFAVSDRLAHGMAQLQVLTLPRSLEEAVDATNEYVDRLAAERTQAVKDEWTDVYSKLHAEIRATFGAATSKEIEGDALAK